MQRILLFLLIFFMCTALSAQPDFWQYWGDGKGEVSTYKLKTPRYGEIREGHAVLIFVTEDMHRSTRIKVEAPNVPASQRVHVLKMNNIMKFPTGIYDYSVMTSVFSAIESELDNLPFSPMKISFTSQEWCGHVFNMLIPHADKVEVSQHSYFEGEGDANAEIELPEHVMYEDNFPIWIRELKGEKLQADASLSVEMVPKFWAIRKQHKPLKIVPASISKQTGEPVDYAGISGETWLWQLEIDGRTERFWVEQAYPHRIVKFTSSDGTEGELLKTERLPYWQMNGTENSSLRHTFKLK